MVSILSLGLSGGSSGATIKVNGNGYVIHNDGAFHAGSILGVAPARTENESGIGGQTLIRAEAANHPLGALIGASLTTTADQVIQLPQSTAYAVRAVLVTGASLTPTGVTGGIYTLPSKGGITLASFPSLNGMTDRMAMVQVVPTLQRLEAPYLYLHFDTVVGSGTIDVYVFGDVLRTLED